MVIQLTDIFKVEARAIREGLKLVWVWSFCKLEVKSNNILLVDILQNRLVENNSVAEVKMIHS